jgi:hypothetical protein
MRKKIGFIAASVLVICTRSSAFVSQTCNKNHAFSTVPTSGSVPRPSKLFLSDRALELEERISAATAVSSEKNRDAPSVRSSSAPATNLSIKGAVGEVDAEYKRGLLTIGFSK